MSTIDFNKPATTDAYATAFVPNLQGNMQSLGFMLDPTYVTSIANLQTGMQRFNRTGNGLFEFYNGSAWVAAATGYVLRSGDLMLGALVFSNTVGISTKDSLGTPRRILVGSGASYYVGDIDNATTGSVLHLTGQAGVNLEVNSAIIGQFASTGLGMNKQINFSSTAGAEQVRLASDSGYIAIWNGANSTRTGYLQGSAGSSLALVAENGAALQLGTASTIKATISTGGNLAIGLAPSAWGSAYRCIELNVAGSGIAANSNTMCAVNNVYYNGSNWILGATGAASIYLQAGGAHQWYTLASGAGGSTATPATTMILDAGGNLLVGLGATTSGAAGRAVIEVNGSSTALVALDIGSTRKAYLYASGAAFQIVAEAGTGPVQLYSNGNNGLSVSTTGQVLMMGAATPTVGLGSAGGTITANCALSNVFTLTLNANMTSLTLSNMLDGQTINLQITQDGTGSRLLGGLTNANGFRWPAGTVGVLSTVPNAVDLLVLTKIGSVVLCTLSKGFA